MDRLTIIILISLLYDILSDWGVVEAVLIRLHWGWLLLLMGLLIFLPPVGFGMTMFCKYIIWKKKRRSRKKNSDRHRDGDPDELPPIPMAIGTSPPPAN